MPFIVQDLIEDNPNLVTVRLKDPVELALSRMISNDFSQLPIVDEQFRPEGMITAESILRALKNFGVNMEKLCVEHAKVKADEFRNDADLFELLDRLQATYAVLIVDGERRLKGIVTNYDTAEYFRRRAEDMMLVEDIETMVKDYIQAAYQLENGETDMEGLENVVQQMTDSGQALRNNFERALIHYLTLQSGSSGAPNSEWLETVFNKHFTGERPVRRFDDLTLYEYVELLLHKEQWPRYQPIFNLEREAVRILLDKVRDTRNELAHFRSDVTLAQRDHLRFSANWLAQYQDLITAAFAGKDIDVSREEVIEVQDQATDISLQKDDEANIMPVEDEAEPEESRYAPLAIWLQNQPPRKDLVKPTFTQIEEIIGGDLPRSAYDHRAWWANDPIGHIQSQQWLDVGWRVASVNMTTQVVRFARIKERQKAYIDFFSQLITDLKQEPGYGHLQNLPDGSNWYWTHGASSNDTYLASFNFSFGRGGIFRIELYIDTGKKELNKQLFDALHENKAAIEDELGELYWQRLNNRRASRISKILQGSITDSEDKLENLRAEAIPTMIKFTNILRPQTIKIGQSFLET